MEVLYGLHPVEEALKASRRRFDHVLVAREREDARIERLVALCLASGVRVRQESREQLTQLAQTPAHQGVVALVHPQEFLSIEDLFTPLTPGSPRLLLALDGVDLHVIGVVHKRLGNVYDQILHLALLPLPA